MFIDIRKDIVGQEINILKYLGITEDNGYVNKGSYLSGPAPCHGGDNPTGFSFLYEHNIWACWTHHCEEEFGKSLVGLIKAVKRVDTQTAVDIVKGIVAENPIDNKIIEKPKRQIDYWKLHLQQPTLAEEIIGEFEPPDVYCQERGFNIEIAQRYKMGVATFGPLALRFVIPIRNVNGHLVGLSGRLLKYNKEDKIGKWYHWPRSENDEEGNKIKGFSKSLNLFNIENVSRYSKETNTTSVILTEGPFDVLKFEMAGIHNAVAVFGDNICVGQIEVLQQCNFTDIILAFDNDAAGIKGRDKTARKLEKKLFRLWTISSGNKKDWGECSTEEIKTALSNRVKV